MKNFNAFKAFFDANMHGTLEAIEHRRLTMFQSQTKMGVWAVGMCFLHMALIYLGILHQYTLPFTLLIAPSIAYFIYRKYYIDLKITDDFKKAVVGKMIEFFGESLRYDAEKYVEYEKFRSSELIMFRPDHYGGDDLITGEIDEVPIEFSEIELLYESNQKTKKNQNKWKKAFHGIFLVATVTDSFKGKTIILPSRLEKKLGFAGRLLHQNYLYGGEYITAQNPLFRENFVVYSDNELEAEELLSEEFMDKLLTLRRTSRSDVYCSFKEDKIYVALNLNRELFKVKINKSLININYLKQFYADFSYMLDVIDELNIDEMDFPTETQDNTMPEEAYNAPPDIEDTPPPPSPSDPEPEGNDLGDMDLGNMDLGDLDLPGMMADEDN